MNEYYHKIKGFTIVELLIVIVVIAILAAITIVAFTGVQQRARTSSVTSALSQVGKKVALFRVENPDAYPSSLAAIDIPSSGDLTYQYRLTSTGYCATATSGPVSYSITENTQPVSGACVGHASGGAALAQNLITNPSFETNTTNWNIAGGATMNPVTSGPGIVSGLRALEVNVTTASASGAVVYIYGLAASTVYTASVYITPISGDFTNMQLRIGDAAGTRAYVTFSPALTAGQTVRKTLTWTSAPTPGTTGMNIHRANTAPASAVIRVDAAMVEVGPTATPYSEQL